jgi:hypothetical protein
MYKNEVIWERVGISVPYELRLMSHRLDIFLQQRNSAKRAIWSEDHSGEGRAVSFLKLSSSNSSNNDSTTNESAETTKNSLHKKAKRMKN